ncbi:MAG: hypothetical protein VW875_15155 [Planctomycetaceae bacterium]|nr:hypothetical protein [Planctomycetaceae bacterium]|tara:strand:+ start:52 stop:279 length:228 start_codon:yes stop_codon:yes gene_type:complete
MKFVELTGESLAQIINDNEIHADDLVTAGVTPQSIVRINEQGDIEVRRPTQWELVGGLLGNYEERIRGITGIDWV